LNFLFHVFEKQNHKTIVSGATLNESSHFMDITHH
jgi:hypothetical protein